LAAWVAVAFGVELRRPALSKSKKKGKGDKDDDK